jgi:hypothetical protein
MRRRQLLDSTLGAALAALIAPKIVVARTREEKLATLMAQAAAACAEITAMTGQEWQPMLVADCQRIGFREGHLLGYQRALDEHGIQQQP